MTKDLYYSWQRKVVCLVMAPALLLWINCSDGPGTPEEVHVQEAPGCDDLNPFYCALPWPSDRYLETDATLPTGWRLAYSQEVIPDGCASRPFNLAPFDRMDGFSPGSQILTLFASPPDLSVTAYLDTIDRSLEPDSPTVLLDLETGERVPHWVESDWRDTPADKTLVYIRPAIRLEHNRRYAVAIRNLTDADGTPFPPSEAFRALRDGLDSDSALLESRRESYTELFTAFAQAAVPIDHTGLQAAWWWHTASFERTHQDQLDIRADALERIGTDGLGCTIDSVEDDYKGIAYRLVRGTVTTPWYLDSPESPATFVRGTDGVPAYQGNQEVEFTAILPHSLADVGAEGPLVIWGHGLFGHKEQHITSDGMLQRMEDEGFIFAATNWAGMSAPDMTALAGALADVSQFYKMGEHVQQGMVNQITLTRTMLGACRVAPEMTADGTPLIDPDRRYFVGGSQGSILGGTFLTLSPDIDRGALLVGGNNFSFMIERSVHFNTFELFMDGTCPARIDQGFLMALSQHVWDWGESADYLRRAPQGLPGIGPKEFIYMATKNDAQVPNACSDLAARNVGLPALEGSVWVPWGVQEVAAPHQGSVYITMDIGDRDPPPGNQSPETDDGGHGNAPSSPELFDMAWHFFETGEAINPCGGLCVLP